MKAVMWAVEGKWWSNKKQMMVNDHVKLFLTKPRWFAPKDDTERFYDGWWTAPSGVIGQMTDRRWRALTGKGRPKKPVQVRLVVR